LICFIKNYDIFLLRIFNKICSEQKPLLKAEKGSSHPHCLNNYIFNIKLIAAGKEIYKLNAYE